MKNLFYELKPVIGSTSGLIVLALAEKSFSQTFVAMVLIFYWVNVLLMRRNYRRNVSTGVHSARFNSTGSGRYPITPGADQRQTVQGK